MIIQHNIQALNAHRQLGGNNNLVSKNLEKLSSGFRINRAGDDAAGLAISEKMRAQITGLTRAQSNAQDGISLVQTAEGALTEVHSMLNRMVDLSTQSSNGTLKDDDRQKIQDEMNALTEEITRISQSTNFNGINLLDGSMGGGAGTAKIASGNMGSANLKASGVVELTGGVDGSTVKFVTSTVGVGSETATWNGKDLTVTLASNAATTYSQEDIQKIIDKSKPGAPTGSNLKIKIGDGTGTMTTTTTKETTGATASFKGFIAASASNATTGIKISANEGSLANGIAIKSATAAADASAAWSGTDLTLTLDSRKSTYTAAELNALIGKATGTKAEGANGLSFDFEGAKSLADIIGSNGLNGATGMTLAAGSGASGGGLQLQIGDTADAFNKVTVSVDNMSASGLGVSGIAVTAQGVSDTALASIKTAINKVSTNRSAMGALQNRLEHTINNLSVATENMTAAESRIRDVDMAKEMMNFTKNNVLSQAAQAMLAQANQQPQQVLQLLR